MPGGPISLQLILWEMLNIQIALQTLSVYLEKKRIFNLKIRMLSEK